ncbi:monovalent cation/H(+) antiporter subunit G [Alphaproteobacteria bacterium]|nr:monovalent cation/H(+) antiporter subunit G [Alphaproteobacteria bacterium]
MDLFIDIITGLCFFIGSLSIIIGACGLIKLPDVFSRIHAAGMIDTGGTAFFSSRYDLTNRLVFNYS